jgi:acetoin utilization protein AcuB
MADESSFDSLTAADVMTEDPMTIDVSTSVKEAIEIIQTMEVRHLPVVDEGGALIGIVSDRDIRNTAQPFTAAEEEDEESPLEQAASGIMSTNLASVTPGADLGEVIDLMLEQKVGAIPVVEAGTNSLIGIVSYVDILRETRKLFH